MIRCGLFVLIYICANNYVQSVGLSLLRDVSNLIPPCNTNEIKERSPISTDIIVYFHDRYLDGSYIFGYILSSGERRYERGIRYSSYLFVEGFYSYRKFVNSRYVYETTRYTAGKDGYYPSRVEVTYEPPKVPTVDYLKTSPSNYVNKVPAQPESKILRENR